MKPLLFSAIIGSLSISTPCAQYSEPFDAWRACEKYCPEAAKGNPIALHTCFLAAYVRESDPYLGGEDLESFDHCMQHLLKTLGDDKFSEGLALERPEVRSAVGAFLQPKQLESAPKTHKLIRKAPKIDFPLSHSNRDEKKSPLLQRFMRYEEQHKNQ
jgi:hypothetical protein